MCITFASVHNLRPGLSSVKFGRSIEIRQVVRSGVVPMVWMTFASSPTHSPM